MVWLGDVATHLASFQCEKEGSGGQYALPLRTSLSAPEVVLMVPVRVPPAPSEQQGSKLAQSTSCQPPTTVAPSPESGSHAMPAILVPSLKASFFSGRCEVPEERIAVRRQTSRVSRASRRQTGVEIYLECHRRGSGARSAACNRAPVVDVPAVTIRRLGCAAEARRLRINLVAHYRPIVCLQLSDMR
jgi:hypothetical protein